MTPTRRDSLIISTQSKSTPWPTHKVLFVTSFVVGLLALFTIATAYIFKGVSILPYQYTKGLERVYGLFSLSLQALSVFFAGGVLITSAVAALSYKYAKPIASRQIDINS